METIEVKCFRCNNLFSHRILSKTICWFTNKPFVRIECQSCKAMSYQQTSELKEKSHE